MNTLKKNFLAFLRFNQIFVGFLILALTVQLLVGISPWKVVLICLFLGLISWFKYQYNLRVVGNFIMVTVAVLWIYHIIAVEFSSNGPSTEKMMIMKKRDVDVKEAKDISPNLVGNLQALIFAKQTMQNEYADKVNQALLKNDLNEVSKLNDEAIELTKKYDAEIKKLEDAGKNSLKNDAREETPYPVNRSPEKNIQQVNYYVPKVEEATYNFPANEIIDLPINMKIGDKLEYFSSTAKFQVKGKYQWWTISDYTVHYCTGNKPLQVRGCGKSGRFTIRVTHN